MLTLSGYKEYSSFSADGLVNTVNELLQSKGLHPFTKRALRYYISEGVLPSAIGPAKFARYRYEHLLGILAARMFQYRGFRLDDIKVELAKLHTPEAGNIEKEVDDWIAEPSLGSSQIYDLRKNYQTKQGTSRTFIPLSTSLQRIQLTQHICIEIREGANLENELRKARREIDNMIKTYSAALKNESA